MMEDCIEVIMQDHTAGGIIIIAVRMIGLAFAGVYGLWAMFCMSGLRVPFRPKQTQNVIKLVDGRKGRLADLGSEDGRLPIQGVKHGGVVYQTLMSFCQTGPLEETDLSKYRNVMVFLAPAVMGVLEEKLLKELPEDARLIVCRFPFPRWPHSCTAGSGLNQVWVYAARDLTNTPTH